MRFLLHSTALLCLALALAACSPTYNWRDYSSPDAPYRVMFPDKPAKHTRSVDLNGVHVNMTMTAAEVEGTMFAVGSAETADPAQAQAALDAMKTALVRNIGATLSSEKRAAGPVIDIEATGVQNGQPMRLVGHFEARGKRIYQVVALGRARDMQAEQVDQFMSSFALQ
ncbi:hypothetical protein E4L96_13995 [Massilia arenosa]|uniref:DUF1795 domain-containing protein n=1 Tax=Zemynaea arenosa TaxID=2561931 RepID=A0A4Y9S870_9BURK|nr:hypothetical protein [Massilia arenosa]TFW17770.1 hypothetical protein E4L96_13995 [Massilia arenosa]